MFLIFIYSILYSLQPILSVQKDLYNSNQGKYRYDNKKMAKLQQFAKALQLSVVFDQHVCWKGFMINFTHKN